MNNLFHFPQKISLRFRDYSLRTKLIISFLAVTLVSISIVGLITNRITSAQITDQVGTNLSATANGVAIEIASSLDDSTNKLQTLSLNKFLQDTVQAANANANSDVAIFKRIDQQWAAAGDSDPLIQGVINNDLADELREFQAAYPEYVEIFATDKFGAILASTNRTSDYYQADEGWWQTAWNNGKGTIYIGQPEFDESSKTLSVNLAKPVLAQNSTELVGILRFTLNITNFAALVDAVKIGKTGRSDLIFGDQILRSGVAGLTPVVAAEMAGVTALVGKYGQTTYEGVRSLVTLIPITTQITQHKNAIDQLGWKVIVYQSVSEAQQPVTTTTRSTLIAAFVIAFFVVLAALGVAQYLAGPLVRLTAVAQQVAAGDINVQAKVESADESGTLANAFNSMTSRLREFINTLEGRVAERTQSLELAAEVGRAVSQVRALDILLKDAAELIRVRFDLYYVQVYLVDASQTNLVLQTGTGRVGEELVGRAHHLPLNNRSINGRAATEKRSVVIANTATSANFRPNPLLPDTRSEMAVPLLVGDRVVGVLDMQSKIAGSLSQEVLSAFEALAGQLAIAIQNANLLAEAEQARAELEKQAAQQVRANWHEYLDAVHQPERIGYMFDHNQVVPLAEADGNHLPADGNFVSASITVTGEPLGTLVVELDKGNQKPQTTELINIVARQVAQQVENLRLLESSERYRFEAEEASRRQTRAGWQDYLEVKANEGMSYIYDLNEVRASDRYDDQRADAFGLSLPLKVHNETIGRLAVAGIEDDEAIRLVTAVAERLSAHIEDLRLSEQTQSALAQTEKLSEASLKFAQAADLQKLVEIVAETLSIPKVNRVVLGGFQYNTANVLESMDVVANWWNGTGHEVTPVGMHYTLEMLRVLPLFMSTKPIFYNDTLNDERADPATVEIIKSQQIRALAVLPLILGDRQIGALLLESEEPHTFSEGETNLFIAMGPQIATVLENRRQFERAQKQAERESTLNIISQKIQGATTVEAVLQIAARELGHALGAPLTIAQLGMKDHGN